MNQPPLSFVHRFGPGREDANDRSPLLLLHGTGGDEHDIVPLGQSIAPGAALLAPRGQILENGMPRFFRRLREGVFDQEDVRRRAGELAGFVGEARERYALGRPVAVGFSNGANIAAALLWLYPDVLAGAVLLRAMVPLDDRPPADLTGKPILILSGEHDRLIAPEHAARLARLLSAAGAAVTQRTLAAGHGLTRADVDHARTWLRSI